MKEKDAVDIIEILKIIRKRIVIIIIVPLLVVGISGLINYLYLKPVYQAKASIILGLNQSSQINPSESKVYEEVSNTFVEIGKSSLVAENAAKRMNNSVDARELQNEVNITSQKGTQIIIISFNSNDPKDAANKVEAMSQAIVEEGNSLLSSGTAKIIDKAEIPTKAIKPQKEKNIIFAFMLGLAAAIGIAYFCEMLDNTIKDENDVKKYLGIPVMGIIPKCKEDKNELHNSRKKSKVCVS